MGWVWGTWTHTPTTLVLINREIVKILKFMPTAYSLGLRSFFYFTVGSVNVYTRQNDKNK